MRTSPCRSSVVVVLALGLASGCTSGDEPGPTASSRPSSGTPSSTSSARPSPSAIETPSPAEQDLADAEEAVVRFWRVLDRVGTSTGEDPNALATVARDQALAQWQSIVAGYRSRGLVTKGVTVTHDVRATKKTAGTFEVQACVDVSGVDLVDAAGKSVVASSRPDRQQYTYLVVQAADGLFVTRDTLKGKPC